MNVRIHPGSSVVIVVLIGVAFLVAAGFVLKEGEAGGALLLAIMGIGILALAGKA